MKFFLRIVYKLNCLAVSDDSLNNNNINDNVQINDINHQTNQEKKLDKETKPYTFNKKVVLGIAIIISISAIITLFATSISQSSSINISFNLLPKAEKSSSVSITNSLMPIAADSTDSINVDKRFVLIQQDFGWNGTSLGPSIEVSKGNIVQIVIINAGTMAHNFGIAKISPYSMALLNETMTFPSFERINHISYNDMSVHSCPGCKPMFQDAHINTFMEPLSQQVITFTANEPGEFKYFCMVRGHLWLGMFGDFIVKEKGA